ncbi:MAG: hypothetical protein Q9208_004490 [Pyrenodesmia sp. 3 TL-2023]
MASLAPVYLSAGKSSVGTYAPKEPSKHLIEKMDDEGRGLSNDALRSMPIDQLREIARDIGMGISSRGEGRERIEQFIRALRDQPDYGGGKWSPSPANPMQVSDGVTADCDFDQVYRQLQLARRLGNTFKVPDFPDSSLAYRQMSKIQILRRLAIALAYISSSSEHFQRPRTGEGIVTDRPTALAARHATPNEAGVEARLVEERQRLQSHIDEARQDAEVRISRAENEKRELKRELAAAQLAIQDRKSKITTIQEAYRNVREESIRHQKELIMIRKGV